MSLLLVNSAPGDSTDPIKPGQAVQFGLRSDGGGGEDVVSGNTQAYVGLSSIINEGSLPESDQNLSTLGVSVARQTSEHRLPVNVDVPRAIVSGSLVLTKSTNSDNDRGIYEISIPVEPRASVLGYFKFRKRNAWSLFSPDWLDLTTITGMYFGLEHGSFNTGLFAFLRNPGATRSLVIGGPLQSFGTDRPAQAEFSAFDWGVVLADNSALEIWIYFNSVGYPSPFSPTFVPVAEVWTRRQGLDVEPVLQAKIAVSTLGTFQPPASNFSNYRNGPADRAVLYFGNVGRTGDVLQLDDWALFPDFRFAVSNGEPLPNCDRVFVPDVPSQFFAENGSLPQNLSVGKWLPVPDPGFSVPSTSPIFQPGRKSAPQSIRIAKSLAIGSAFQKSEPRLKEKLDGAMIEAFMAGTQTARVADVFGAGLSIEDGSFVYSAILIQSATLTTIGVAKTVAGTALVDYYLPVDSFSNPIAIDWTSLKMVRLVVDRLRLKVALIVDEVRVMEVALGGSFPPSLLGQGRVMFGHQVLVGAVGSMDVSKLTYLNRYKAWEILDQKTPQDVTAAPGFGLVVSGAGTVALDVAPPNATAALINKPDFSASGTHCYLSHAEDLAEVKGVQIDFQTQVLSYTDAFGSLFKSLTWTGAGLQLWFGNKRLHLGFFDAGTNGRVIGIVPGSGTAADIINQTTLGKSFSAPIDWTQDTLYRLVVSGYNSIQLWISTFVGAPVIDIPWRGDAAGFDLPADLTSPALAFGHFDELASSKMAWKGVRYGISTGYDMSVNLKYPNGMPRYLFGGKSFVRSIFTG